MITSKISVFEISNIFSSYLLALPIEKFDNKDIKNEGSIDNYFCNRYHLTIRYNKNVYQILRCEIDEYKIRRCWSNDNEVTSVIHDKIIKFCDSHYITSMTFNNKDGKDEKHSNCGSREFDYNSNIQSKMCSLAGTGNCGRREFDLNRNNMIENNIGMGRLSGSIESIFDFGPYQLNCDPCINSSKIMPEYCKLMNDCYDIKCNKMSCENRIISSFGILTLKDPKSGVKMSECAGFELSGVISEMSIKSNLGVISEISIKSKLFDFVMGCINSSIRYVSLLIDVVIDNKIELEDDNSNYLMKSGSNYLMKSGVEELYFFAPLTNYALLKKYWICGRQVTKLEYMNHQKEIFLKITNLLDVVINIVNIYIC